MSKLLDMGADQSDGLDFGSPAPAPTATPAPSAPSPGTRVARRPIERQDDPVVVQRIEVDAVIGGCLMKITLGAGMSPEGVLPYLRTLDPNCKVRDDFPSKSFGGKRETLRARLLVITLRATDNGLFIDLVCRGEKDVSVAVSKKKAPEFRDLIAGCGKVSSEHLESIDTAIVSKGSATVVLVGDEAVDVEYWTTDDGKAFLEALHPAEGSGGN